MNPTPVVNNTCYSYINDREAVHVASVHQYDAKQKTFLTVPGSGGLSAAKSAVEGDYGFAWARSIWADMLRSDMSARDWIIRRTQSTDRRRSEASAWRERAPSERRPLLYVDEGAERRTAALRRDVLRSQATGPTSGFGRFLEAELDLVVVADVDRHLAAIDEPAEQQLVGERLADRVLDEPRHRARAHLRIEALLRQELAQLRRERRVDLLLVQLRFELEQELVDDAQDDLVVERAERDRRVEPVAELGREHPLDLAHLVARLLVVA